ncbi:L-type lectin-like domain-containing protein [Aphelenchoides fujianensis]|nr:L-type lectin-like domain-containing protein [Aphelenchoides fujianensis]
MRWSTAIGLAAVLIASVGSQEDAIDGSFVTEQRGYFKREHSLMRPYQSAGMDVPYWDITGSTMVTGQQIRLTQNLQGRQGGIWNAMPVQSRDWEVVVSFRVHGDSGKLFGDGMAIWYVRDRAQIGEVFGAPNHFSGLGVFIDTYSNEYKSYMHTFPYIYSMINNGTLKYEGDTDGSSTQLGGTETGCEVKVRNKEYDTQVLIRYVGDTLTARLQVFEDTENNGKWKQCFRVPGVHLPTGYFFGLTAATGDLSDNHDVISVKTYEIEYARAVNPLEGNSNQILPNADVQAAPRDHSSNPQPSKLSTWGKYLLIFIGIVATAGGIGVFGYLYYKDKESRSRKRFY